MRVVFICGALEPGRDGVGDYCRRLAAELFRQGHACALVGWNDFHVTQVRRENQESDGAFIPVIRLPPVMSPEQRVTEARNWLKQFAPDWISLQFVPFGFHPKGLCFGIGKSLAAIGGGASWHVMFHELWLGIGENSPIKHRILGALQKRIVLDLVRRLRPKFISTQADPYKLALARENVTASILPLFGNIPFTAGDAWTHILEPLVTQATGAPQNRHQLYLAGILGGVHPEWNAEDSVNALLPLTKREGKRLVLVFHGKNNLPPEAFAEMNRKFQDRADIVVTGEKPGPEISRILQTLDLGLATSPRQILQKSGSVAAMLEHGLTLLVTRDDWRLRDSSSLKLEMNPRLFSVAEFAALEKLPVRDLKVSNTSGVVRVAEKMLAAMDSVSRPGTRSPALAVNTP